MAVLGIGGLFFRARNPEALGNWYREHLNVGAGCVAPAGGDADDMCWMAEGGPIVFAPFPANSDYFPTERQFMLNLRVTDLEQMIEQLRESGTEVQTREEWNDPNVGRFARIHDPEGNPIELWEAAAS
jgi:catechol 2,3-dioxygenase-like lactoylglutathione lyase family enzyme